MRKGRPPKDSGRRQVGFWDVTEYVTYCHLCGALSMSKFYLPCVRLNECTHGFFILQCKSIRSAVHLVQKSYRER